MIFNFMLRNINMIFLGSLVFGCVTNLLSSTWIAIIIALMLMGVYMNACMKKNIFKFNVIIVNFIIMVLCYLAIGGINSDIHSIISIAIPLFINISIIFITYKSIDNEKKMKFITNVCKYSGVLLAIMGIMEFLGILTLSTNSYYQINGRVALSWGNPNMYGFALVFSYICSLKDSVSVNNYITKIIIVLGIAVSMSRSALVILLVCITINRAINSNGLSLKKISILVISFFTVVGVYKLIFVGNYELNVILDNSRLQRLNVFKQENESVDITNGRGEALVSATNLAIKNPLIGVGLKNVPNYSDHKQAAHNTYINIFAESGIIPIMLYLLLLYNIYNITRNQNDELKLILFIMIMLYGFFAHTVLFNHIVGISLGLISVNQTKNKYI